MVEDENEKDLGIFNALADWLVYKSELKKTFNRFIDISLGAAAFLYFLNLIGQLDIISIPLVPLLAEPMKVLILLSPIPALAIYNVICRLMFENPNPLDKMIEKIKELNKIGYKVKTSKLLKAKYLSITMCDDEDRTLYTDKNTVIVETKKGETLTITERLEYLNRFRKELVSTKYKLEPPDTKIKNKKVIK